MSPDALNESRQPDLAPGFHLERAALPEGKVNTRRVTARTGWPRPCPGAELVCPEWRKTVPEVVSAGSLSLGFKALLATKLWALVCGCPPRCLPGPEGERREVLTTAGVTTRGPLGRKGLREAVHASSCPSHPNETLFHFASLRVLRSPAVLVKAARTPLQVCAAAPRVPGLHRGQVFLELSLPLTKPSRASQQPYSLEDSCVFLR